MIGRPRQNAAIRFITHAMMIACAFVGFCAWAGYNVGKDMARNTFWNEG